MIRRRSAGRCCTAAAALLALAACGKKGPPLAPLHLVPSRVEELKATRRGNDVELRFTLPKTNVNGPGPVRLDRIEVYAMTIAPGLPTPPNRELLTKAHFVGSVPVKPPPEEGASATAQDPKDTRPSPGEPAAFVETLTEAKLQPTAQRSTPTPAAAADKAAAQLPFLRATAAKDPIRVYGVRGMAGGRPGAPSGQVAVPLAPAPAPPDDVRVTYTEQALTVSWAPPAAADDSVPPELAEWMFLAPQFPYLFYKPPSRVSFNVYLAERPTPINTAPITKAEFARAAVEFGAEQCYIVRSVRTAGSVSLESAASEPACVTPVDTFPPAAPKGLQAVAGAGEINLSWDANTESDLAGYIVLRGDATSATLQPLTAAITETRYRDTTVSPGMRYVYAIVAIDKATPPNMSAQSPRADETAR